MDNEVTPPAVAPPSYPLAVRVLLDALRPFARVADAQQHVDCGGMLHQSDWERAATTVHVFEGKTHGN